MHRHVRTPAFRSLAVLAFALACAPAFSAEGIYRCSANGRTTYQATPCVNTGSQGAEMAVRAGPTEQQVQDAKRRAADELARASSAGAAQQAAQPAPAPNAPVTPPTVASAVDCAKLNQQRAEAFGRRNATARNSRNENVDRSAEVVNQQSEISRTERALLNAGCKPT